MKHNAFLFAVAFTFASSLGLASDGTVSGTTRGPASETTEKSEFRRKIDAQLDSIESGIADLKKSANETTGDAKTAMNEKIAKLEKRRDELKSDLSKTTGDSGRAWAKFKAGMQKSVKELETGFDEAKAEFKAKTSKK